MTSNTLVKCFWERILGTSESHYECGVENLLFYGIGSTKCQSFQDRFCVLEAFHFIDDVSQKPEQKAKFLDDGFEAQRQKSSSPLLLFIILQFYCCRQRLVQNKYCATRRFHKRTENETVCFHYFICPIILFASLSWPLRGS